MITRWDVVAEARSWQDTPYRHQGYRKGVGADCIGLVAGIALALGLPSGAAWKADRAMHNYARLPDPVMLLAAAERYLSPIPIESAREGDILLLRWRNDPSHFAIITETSPLTVLHAYARGPRKVAEHNIAGEFMHGVTWASRIVSAWRYRELA